MKIAPPWIFFVLLASLLNAAVVMASDHDVPAATKPAFAVFEQRYVATRDLLIGQLKNADRLDEDEGPALVELEKQLKTLIGPIRIKGFADQGRINLMTLLPEPGFEQVDGLRFDAGQEALVVTTITLLEKYLADQAALPRDINQLSKNGDFFRRVFHADAGVAYYAEVPVQPPKGVSFVHAFLGMSTQDDRVPAIPSELFVFVRKGHLVLLVSSPAVVDLPEIQQCRQEWDAFEKKRRAAFDRYRATRLADEAAFAAATRYEKQGIEAYRHCYGKEAEKQPFFFMLTKQAQSIVNRLAES